MINIRRSELQRYIREHGAPDAINVDGCIFTMDHYDKDGVRLAYGNKRLLSGLLVKTANRYETWGDAVVSDCGGAIRTDIDYID